MASISCPECNKQISDKADICVICGAPFKYIYIIDRPIKIMGLIIAQYDFPNPLSWNDAKNACQFLGKSWRLPTQDELNIMCRNKNKIGGFSYNGYWTSSELNINFAWIQDFYYQLQYDVNKHYKLNVRAIKPF